MITPLPSEIWPGPCESGIVPGTGISGISLKFVLSWVDPTGSPPGLTISGNSTISLTRDLGTDGAPPPGTFQIVQNGCCGDPELFANFDTWGSNIVTNDGGFCAIVCADGGGTFGSAFSYGNPNTGITADINNCCFGQFYNGAILDPIWTRETGGSGTNTDIIDLSTETFQGLIGNTFTGSFTDTSGNSMTATLKFT